MQFFKKFLIVITVILYAPAINAIANEKCCANCIDCHTLTTQEAELLLGLNAGEAKKIRVSSVKGLWEITFEKEKKKSVAYMDFGKKHVINGPIFNIVPPKQASLKTLSVDQIPLAGSIVMGNPQSKKRLFVFSDPDCPYCAELHSELKKLVEKDKDVAIYIKMFPLKNIHPDAYSKACVILERRSLAVLEDVYADKSLPQPRGVSSKEVDSTIALGERLGVHSTPTMVLPDGRIESGYMKAEEIEDLIKN